MCMSVLTICISVHLVYTRPGRPGERAGCPETVIMDSGKPCVGTGTELRSSGRFQYSYSPNQLSDSLIGYKRLEGVVSDPLSEFLLGIFHIYCANLKTF